jgi:hypothetical protein
MSIQIIDLKQNVEAALRFIFLTVESIWRSSEAMSGGCCSHRPTKFGIQKWGDHVIM